MKKRRAKKMAKAEKELEEIKKELNDKQKIFCQLYVLSKDHFCNATRSYMAAYELKPSQYKSGMAHGTRMVRNGNIRAYIDFLLKEHFNSTRYDLELTRVAIQNNNLIAKMQAIEHYNKLKGRITEKTKTEHTF